MAAYNFWLAGLLEYSPDYRLWPSTFDHGPEPCALEVCILSLGRGVIRELKKNES